MLDILVYYIEEIRRDDYNYDDYRPALEYGLWTDRELAEEKRSELEAKIDKGYPYKTVYGYYVESTTLHVADKFPFPANHFLA